MYIYTPVIRAVHRNDFGLESQPTGVDLLRSGAAGSGAEPIPRVGADGAHTPVGSECVVEKVEPGNGTRQNRFRLQTDYSLFSYSKLGGREKTRFYPI